MRGLEDLTLPLLDYLNFLNHYAGSDLHLVSGVTPVMRLNGALVAIAEDRLAPEHVYEMLHELLSDDAAERLHREKNIDFAYAALTDDGATTRYRGNAFLQKNGPSVVLRLIPSVVPTLQALGLPDSLHTLTEHYQGMILVTGPAGCGKTSTVAALVDVINRERACHIITLEDPIEYVHVNKRALVNQRQVGRDVESFATALRGALREDPDVIVVGELRDLETVSLAVTAAETGHVVFGTLHTQSAAKTVDRLVDSFPIEQQPQIRTMLSESLRGVITQQLVPSLDGRRVPAVEVLVGTLPVATLIREGRTYQIPYTMETGRKLGMRTLDDSLLELFQQGRIGREEAALRSTNKRPYATAAYQPNFARGAAPPTAAEPQETALAEDKPPTVLMLVCTDRNVNLPLLEGEVIIGREEGDIVLTGDGAASRRHARIRIEPDGLWVEDLGSTNGTLVNGKKITSSVRVRGDDTVKVGKSTFRIQQS